MRTRTLAPAYYIGNVVRGTFTQEYIADLCMPHFRKVRAILSNDHAEVASTELRYAGNAITRTDQGHMVRAQINLSIINPPPRKFHEVLVK